MLFAASNSIDEFMGTTSSLEKETAQCCYWNVEGCEVKCVSTHKGLNPFVKSNVMLLPLVSLINALEAVTDSSCATTESVGPVDASPDTAYYLMISDEFEFDGVRELDERENMAIITSGDEE